MAGKESEILSNAELWIIAERNDKDITRLVSFILYLKRKLGKAQRHIDEQRKHLNTQAIKSAKDANSANKQDGQHGQGGQDG